MRKLLLGMLCCLSAAACADDYTLLHQERSLYREVFVYQDQDERCMCFTNHCRVGRQSCRALKEPQHIVMTYPRLMLGALYVDPAPKRVLIIGLGGGTLPDTLLTLLPQSQIDVVEIDP